MTLDPTSFTVTQLAMAQVARQERLKHIEQEAREVIEGVKALPVRPPEARRSWWSRAKYVVSMPVGMAAGALAGLLNRGAFVIFLIGAFTTLAVLVTIEHFTERE